VYPHKSVLVSCPLNSQFPCILVQSVLIGQAENTSPFFLTEEAGAGCPQGTLDYT